MLTKDEMLKQVSNYQIYLDERRKEALITKGAGMTSWVKVSHERALQWIHAGIDDLDARDKEDMLILVNQWIKEDKKEI